MGREPEDQEETGLKVIAHVEVDVAYRPTEEELRKTTALRCYFCGGRLVSVRTTYRSPLGITIRGVPAFECEQCGEIYFDAETSRRMDELVKAVARALRSGENHLASEISRVITGLSGRPVDDET